MNHLSLFNGIGGFQLAAAWVGWNNVAHVEIDDYCNAVVKRHFPESKCFKNIRNFDGTKFKGAIDIISGGDPCQPHSNAGLGKGQDDDRYLWPEMFRIIREIHPAWVVNENVTGSISNGILDVKISHLEGEGYACQAFVIPAAAVGALHQRDRVWFVAYDADSKSKSGQSGYENYIKTSERIRQPEEPVDLWNDVANTNGERSQKQYDATEPGILQEGVSRYFGFGDAPYGHIPENEIKSAIIRSLDGLPEGLDYPWRNQRIKALGNAIVPQVAYELFKAINAINKAP